MNVTAADESEARWQKTPVANLLRHHQSGNYYARIRVRGKLIWKSLETDRISVAKLSRNHAVGIQRKGAKRQRRKVDTAKPADRPTAVCAQEMVTPMLGCRPLGFGSGRHHSWFHEHGIRAFAGKVQCPVMMRPGTRTMRRDESKCG